MALVAAGELAGGRRASRRASSARWRCSHEAGRDWRTSRRPAVGGPRQLRRSPPRPQAGDRSGRGAARGARSDRRRGHLLPAPGDRASPRAGAVRALHAGAACRPRRTSWGRRAGGGRFTLEFSQIDADRFASEVLAERLGARTSPSAITTATATAPRAPSRHCARRAPGWGSRSPSCRFLSCRAGLVSSSRIRDLIGDGRGRAAPPSCSAGRRGWRGRWCTATAAAASLGFPTANLEPLARSALPGRGSLRRPRAPRLRLEPCRRRSASATTRPSRLPRGRPGGGPPARLRARHLWSPLRLEFTDRLRDE